MPDQIELAIHNTVHATPESCANLARAMGKSHQVFINKANSNCETHHFTNPEILAIQLHTGNNSIHRAMGMVLGEQSIRIPTASEKTPFAALMDSIIEHGDVPKKYNEIMADGVVTEREKADLNNEIDEAVEKLLQFQAQINRVNISSTRKERAAL